VSITLDPSWMQFDEDLDDIEPEAPKSYKFYNDTIEVFFDPGPHVYYRYVNGERRDIDGVTTVLGVIAKPFLVPWATKLTIETLKKRMFWPDGRLKNFSTEELLAWFKEAKDKHKERLNEAGDIGTLAHNALEDAIKHAIAVTNGVVQTCPIVKVDPVNPATEENIRKAQNCVNRAFEWMQAHNVRWLHTERKIYSLEFDYSGTLDGDALIDSCTDRFCKGCRGRVFKDRRAITDWKSSNHLSDSYAYQTAAYQFAHIEEFPDLYIPDRWIMRLGKEEGDFEAWYLPAEYFEADFEAFLAALQLYRSLDEIEERRKKETREFNELTRATKKAEKVEAVAAEKKAKTEAKDALKAAKQQWDTDRDIHYKNLRAQKFSVDDAKRLTEEKYPKANRPGAKEEAAESIPEAQQAAPAQKPVVQLRDDQEPSKKAVVPAVSGVRGARVWKL
jgi:hypothetical protein